ncbi:putative transport protein [Deinococcus metalli]|uniref:Putative transport protein n=1 Tax=Deinococcus metalli TaxID=1141878 RepID=A0A7W8NNK1_9DEIO|nr:DUF4287 domain-containing protein [Deinococcus metalli]MBB5376999.1 putative transport protein [Deinococcus metalli]GHF46939.1 hypothetical protein GCM10017781_24270 [Deinococcus metalli]
MSFQAYLDTVHAKTGKTVADFRTESGEKGLTKHGEIVAWLKQDYGLGHGHANAIAAALLKADHFAAPKDDRSDAVFSGKKAVWKPAFDSLRAAVSAFGDDVDTAPTDTYVSFTRSGKKFAIVQPTTGRLDIGLKRRDAAVTERFEAAGSWNTMVTHRVRIDDAAHLDADVLAWLRAAYEGAK